MGNTHYHHHHHFELDRPNAIFLPNDSVSGTVSFRRLSQVSVVLTGAVSFKKHKKENTETRLITFFLARFDLAPGGARQRFDFRLAEHLPPSFNQPDIYPHICYTVNLVHGHHTRRIHASLPITVCPQVPLYQPRLLEPLFFGPIQNREYDVTVEVKANRAAFVSGDTIQVYFELKNPRQELIYRIQVSVGLYILVDSDMWHADICQGIENLDNVGSKSKLIRNKILITIPNENYLPPTFKFKHGVEGHESSFNLTIDYKLQVRVFLGEAENMWQVDMPILLCHGPLEEIKNDAEFISQSQSEMNLDDNE